MDEGSTACLRSCALHEAIWRSIDVHRQMRPPSEPLTATQLRKESSVGTPPRSLSRRSGRQGTKRDGIGSCHASPPGDKAAGESYCVSIYLTHARHESPGQHLGNNNARQHPHRCFSLRVIVSLCPQSRRPFRPGADPTFVLITATSATTRLESLARPLGSVVCRGSSSG